MTRAEPAEGAELRPDLLLPASPYKGLVPYTEEDTLFFFGRDAEREIIAANLTASRLTLLYGASGVGKSSVLRAGVVRELRAQGRQNLAARGSPEFAVAVFTAWRDDPVAGVAACVARAVQELLGEEVYVEPPPPGRLAEVLHAWAERVDGDLLIILDQFEEFFLYHDREDGAGTFAVEFPRAVNRLDLRANFLISIREDAIARLDLFKGRIPNLFDTYLRIQHLDPRAARAAICGPVERYNQLATGQGHPDEIEPGLVEAVLDQVRTGQVVVGQAGRGAVDEGDAGGAHDVRIETPYLQLVMSRIWDEEVRSGSSILRLATLERLGGAERIVRTHLDQAMSELDEQAQEVAARVFHHLVTPSGTKIAHTTRDLAEYAEIPEADLTPTLELLSGSDVRILRPVPAAPGDTRGVRYEIFHDVLADAILDWRARYEQRQSERRLTAELEEHERQRREAEEQRHKELRNRLVRWLAVVLALGVIGSSVATAFALRQKGEAERQRELARASELAATAMSLLPIDPELSLLLADQAVREQPTPQAEEALRQALVDSKVRLVLKGHEGAMRDALFDRDGSRVLTTGADGTVRLWDAKTGAQLREFAGPPGSSLHAVAISPDGTLVAAARDASWDAYVWDVAAGGEPIPLKHFEEINDLSFSSDGSLLVSAGDDGGVYVWNPRTGTPIATVHQAGRVIAAMLGRDGQLLLVAGNDGTVRLWDLARRTTIARFAGAGAAIAGAAISPDGSLIATVSENAKTARIWDVATEMPVAELRGHTDLVIAATFSPDGSSIVTASRDGTARVWDSRTGRSILELRGHSDKVNAAAFSADGDFVVTASDDGTARLWEVATGHELRGHDGRVNAAEFSRDGKRVVTVGSDGRAAIWATDTGRQLFPAFQHGRRALYSASFSPDGTRLATASSDGTVRLWDLSSGAWTLIARHEDDVATTEFSPDGRRLVTASFDGTAGIWDTQTRTEVVKLPSDGNALWSATFSRSGRRILTAGADGTARLWDAETGRPLLVLRHPSGVTSAAFNSSGTRAVTATRDGTAYLWDLSSGRRVELRGHTGPVWSAAFSPDGRFAITASSDATARIWETSSGQLVVALRPHADFVTSAAFSPNGRSILTASDDGTARVFRCDVCASLDDALALARARLARTGRQLTDAERTKYLHQ